VGAAHHSIRNAHAARNAGSNGNRIVYEDLARKRLRGIFDEVIDLVPEACFESVKCVRDAISRSGITAKVAIVFSAVEP
jgi:hypothetical protein